MAGEIGEEVKGIVPVLMIFFFLGGGEDAGIPLGDLFFWCNSNASVLRFMLGGVCV